MPSFNSQLFVQNQKRGSLPPSATSPHFIHTVPLGSQQVGVWRVQFNKRGTGHNQVQKQLLPSLLRKGVRAVQAASEFGNSEHSVTNIRAFLAEVYTAGFLTQSVLASFSCRGQSGSMSTGRNPVLSQHSQGSLAQQTQGALMAAGSSSSSPPGCCGYSWQGPTPEQALLWRPQLRGSSTCVQHTVMEFERKSLNWCL